jgi:predicted extracellular nuclease
MKISFFFILTVSLFQSYTALPQERKNDFCVLFYNVENLFNTKNDPDKEDDEFTPEGGRHWTNKKLNHKLINISKAILNSAGFAAPEVVALCEVEDHEVLDRLINTTPLKNFNYKIIHKESPDHRGIDVALLYNAEKVYPLEYKFFPLKNGGAIVHTREILYFSGILNKTDTLHFFVNHWPSRYDGLLESKPMRNQAAGVLKSKVEELQQKFAAPKIIILGDFNDQPSDESISEILNAKPVHKNIESNCLYNLSFWWEKKEGGTLKYQSQWYVFDQCIISGTLLNSKKGFSVVPENAKVSDLPFLLEKDKRYGGTKPFRTYSGYSYEGGFSDHLPILVKLILQD